MNLKGPLHGFDGLRGLAQIEVGRSQKEPRRRLTGVEPQSSLELAHRLALVSGHIQGEAEVHGQAGIVGRGPHQLAVDVYGLLKLSGSH